ncbi:hypothetical protein L6R29_23490 [Myxococcota bacterium]|nr:hypothetical protein [Myxococcota bacterium]
MKDLSATQHNTQAAYEKHLAAFQSVPRDQAILPIYSISDSIFLGLWVAKHAEQDHQRLKKLHDIGEIHYDLIESLHSLVLGLWHAQTLWQNARKHTSNKPQKTTHKQAVALRKELLEAADYVWRADPDIKNILKDIRKGSGAQNLAEDIQRLVAVFEDHWADADGRCAISYQDLASAEQLALSLLHGTVTDGPHNSLVIRNQAFVLFHRSYKETCDAGRFLYRNDPPTAAKRYPRLQHLKSSSLPQ